MRGGIAVALIGLGLTIVQFFAMISAVQVNGNDNFDTGSDMVPIKFKRIFVAHGTPASLGEYPWMALLLYWKSELIDGQRKINKDRMKSFGAGCLIHDRYVLTAAHNIMKSPKDWNLCGVRLGEYDRSSYQNCGPLMNGTRSCQRERITISVEETIIHENYSAQDISQREDIALLKLAVKVHYNEYVKPIDLPKNSMIPGKLWVAGWGKTEVLNTSMILRKIKVYINEWENCATQYKTDYKINITHRQICAEGANNEDSCEGDSGGPLMASSNKTGTIYGIVSLGPIPCAQSGIPSVYTKVYDYVPWIDKKINSGSGN